jgi:Rrf2 family protein
MIYLAQQPIGSVSLLEDISNAQEVPKYLTAKVLQTLVKGDIIRSSRGVGGGYALARPASKISLLDVVECIEGPIYLNTCLQNEECSKEKKSLKDRVCPVNNVWREARTKLRDVLHSHKIDVLAKNGDEPGR